MYVIPLILMSLLAVVAVVWSPLFAVIVAGLLFVAFLLYAGLQPRASEKIGPRTGSSGEYDDDTPEGAWREPPP